MGAPIDPPPLAPGQGAPSAAQVDALHTQFYDQAARMFERHAATFPGYQGVRLVLV